MTNGESLEDGWREAGDAGMDQHLAGRRTNGIDQHYSTYVLLRLDSSLSFNNPGYDLFLPVDKGELTEMVSDHVHQAPVPDGGNELVARQDDIRQMEQDDGGDAAWSNASPEAEVRTGTLLSFILW